MPIIFKQGFQIVDKLQRLRCRFAMLAIQYFANPAIEVSRKGENCPRLPHRLIANETAAKRFSLAKSHALCHPKQIPARTMFSMYNSSQTPNLIASIRQ